MRFKAECNRKGECDMTEKEKMLAQKLYDANYDTQLEQERLECKELCREYNNLPIKGITREYRMGSAQKENY